MKWQDMGMLQIRCGFDFGQESFGSNDRREFRLQHLQRDFALVLEVGGQVDRRHPALTEFGLDAVAAF